MNPLMYDDDTPVTCAHCDQPLGFNEIQETFFHVKDDDFIRCPGAKCAPRCMWDEVCTDAGGYPLKEESVNPVNGETWKTEYLSWLCQPHLKAAAMLAAGRPIPLNLMPSFTIEEWPG